MQVACCPRARENSLIGHLEENECCGQCARITGFLWVHTGMGCHSNLREKSALATGNWQQLMLSARARALERERESLCVFISAAFLFLSRLCSLLSLSCVSPVPPSTSPFSLSQPHAKFTPLLQLRSDKKTIQPLSQFDTHTSSAGALNTGGKERSCHSHSSRFVVVLCYYPFSLSNPLSYHS